MGLERHIEHTWIMTSTLLSSIATNPALYTTIRAHPPLLLFKKNPDNDAKISSE